MRRISLGHVAQEALKQSYYRIAADMGGPMRALNLRTGRIEPFHRIGLIPFSGHKKIGDALLHGHFEYAGQNLDIGRQGDPWTLPAPSERFAYWLHSFSWLSDLVSVTDKVATVRARFLVDRWIEIYGHWNPYAWDNDILANRVFNWMSVWTEELASDNLSDLAYNRRANLVRQLKRLRGTFLRTPAGLPRLKAAACLALGGLYITDRADAFLDKGLDLLNDELELQILPDGGHISRSPEQALQALHILSVLEQALELRGVPATKILQRATDRLRHVVPFFRMKDGGLACFNGGSEGDRILIKALIDNPKFQPKPFVYCPQTGYQRADNNGTVLVIDTGNLPPRPFDLEAHLGALSFELSTAAGRLIVNCGWNDAQPVAWRTMMRSTAAHSTLTLSDRSAGQILDSPMKSGILGKAIIDGPDDVKASRKDQAAGTWLETTHNGYMKQTGLTHRRRIYIKDDGTDIRGEDGLLVPLGSAPVSRDEIPFDIRFHLHPSVRATLAQDMQSALLIQPSHVGWRFRTDGGAMRIEESVYLGTGERPIRSQQIVISGKAFADSDGETRSNRVRWSLRRLESRS